MKGENMYITETLDTQIKGDYDLIIAGAGVAGVSAAIGAKRLGIKKVLLIEKLVNVGGLATSGLIGWYEPLCDGNGHKIMGGMAEEFCKLAIKHSYDSLPEEWKDFPSNTNSHKRCSTFFSPALFTLSLDKLLKENEVEVLLDTNVVRTIVTGKKCSALVVENKGGRFAYTGSYFLDVTGDSDLLYRSGVPCEKGSNYLTYIAYHSNLEKLALAQKHGSMLYARTWLTCGSDLWGKGHPKGMPELNGLTAEEITFFVRTGQENLRKLIMVKTGKEMDITALPSMAQLRKTRRLVGDYTLEEKDKNTPFASSIAVGGDFAIPGNWYEIPYETLYNSQLENMITAGRTISSANWAWDVTRVIPMAVATAQAAATATALALKHNCSYKQVPIQELQHSLLFQGCTLKAKD
jgi:hypothetical protein